MKKTIFNLIGATVLALAFTACQMDLIPTSSIVYDENEPTIQKESDLVSFEAGIHSIFCGRHQGTFYYVSDLMTDGFNATMDFGNNFGPVHRTDADFTAGNSDVETLYGSYFSDINQFNLDIAAANTIADPELKEAALPFKGYAFFYRAYSYLFLARYFGDAYNAATAGTDLSVPLVTVYDQNARPARATQQQIYDQVKADLDSAAILLKGRVPDGKFPIIRPTIDAVYALYARYYLDIKDFANAADYAQRVIDRGIYKLASSAAEFNAEFVEDEGTEPILQYFASYTESPNSLINYTRITKASNRDVYTPYFLPSAKLLDAYDEGDLRLANWFSPADDSAYPIYMTGSVHVNSDVKVFTKFQGNISYTNQPFPQGQQAIKPFRISEMYLIAAEALFQNSQQVKALEMLNALQTARGATPTTNISMDAIQKEWFRETAGEGQRLWCLKRWGIGFNGRKGQSAALAEGLIYTGEYYTDRNVPAGDYHFTLPIPTYEMKVNPNLVQNKGYDLLNN